MKDWFHSDGTIVGHQPTQTALLEATLFYPTHCTNPPIFGLITVPDVKFAGLRHAGDECNRTMRTMLVMYTRYLAMGVAW
jgi:hypothetical protein